MLSTLKTWLSAIPALFGYRWNKSSQLNNQTHQKHEMPNVPSSFPLLSVLTNPSENTSKLHQAALKLEEDKKYADLTHLLVHTYFRIAEVAYPSSDLSNTPSSSPEVLQANLKLKAFYERGHHLPKSSLYANHYHCKAACLDSACAETFLKDIEQLPTTTQLKDTRLAIPYLQAAIVCLAKPYREQYGLAESIKKAEDYLQQANKRISTESFYYVDSLRDQISYELARHYEAVAVEHATYEENIIDEEDSKTESTAELEELKVNTNPWYEKAADYYSQVSRISVNYVDAQYKAANLYAYSLNNETKAIAVLTKASPIVPANEQQQNAQPAATKKTSFFTRINEWLNSWTNVEKNPLPANRSRYLQTNNLANPINEFLISTPKGELAMPQSDYLITGQQAITPEKINEWQQNCQQPSAFYNSVREIIRKAKIKLGDDVPERRKKEGENSRWSKRQDEIKALEKALEEASFELEIVQPNGTTDRIRIYDDTELYKLCDLIIYNTDDSFSIKALFRGWNQLIDDLESLLEKVIYKKVSTYKNQDIILKMKNDLMVHQQKQFEEQMSQMQGTLASTRQKLDYEKFNAGVQKLKEDHEELNKKYLEQKYQNKQLEQKLASIQQDSQQENKKLLEETEQRHQQEIQQQKADHENQIENLQQEHQQAITQLQSDHDNSVTELKQENTQLRQENEQLRQKVSEQDTIISELRSTVKVLTTQMAKMNSDMQVLNEQMQIMNEERQQDRQTIDKLTAQAEIDRQTIQSLTAQSQIDKQKIEQLTLECQQHKQTIELLKAQAQTDKQQADHDRQTITFLNSKIEKIERGFNDIINKKNEKISKLKTELLIRTEAQASSSNVTEQLQEYIICPITQMPIQEPVATVNGHIYEKSAIEHWFKTSNIDPKTGLPLHDKTLKPVYFDRTRVDDSFQIRPPMEQFPVPSAPLM